MPSIPMGKADYHRSVAKEARIQSRNRYYEANPVLNDTQTAMLSRPALRRYIYVGSGPIRGAVYTQPGCFDNALFVVSGNSWYRVDTNGTVTLIYAGVNPGGGAVSMAATSTIGTTPEYLFMADGRNLFLYMDNSFAKGTLSGSPVAGDDLQIGSVYYQFTAGSVDAGAPAGTMANPWLIAVGATATQAYLNLSAAIGANSGGAGTAYSTALTQNDAVEVFGVSATELAIRATAVGALGNSIVTTVTGAGMAWTAATLTGGGAPGVTQVQTPDDVGIISVGYIASYVVCVPAQDEGINGRFFWIEPGETTIDPLDFATAERSPDPIFGVVVFGDQFWLPGSNTTEVWYFTGNIDSPVLRLQGVTFDRGTWGNTAIQIKESMFIVDNDGAVFQISGGLNRVSDPSIEERIRAAIAYEASRILY